MTAELTPDIDWQRIWVATRQQAWTSLAVIPSDASVEIKRVAESLVATGRLHGEGAVSLLDATGVEFGKVQQLLDALGMMTGRGDRVVVSVAPIADNPSAAQIVRATSAALLVVRLGESLFASARTAIEAVGRERILGCVVLGGKGHERNTLLPVGLP